MENLRAPTGKRRPHFGPDVPSQVRRLLWIKWLRAQAASERETMPVSRGMAAELADLLEEPTA
jgi:hypothetical protein